MESRSAWTDARLDDRFDHVDAELGELRADVRGLRGEISSLRQEVRGEISGLRGEIAELRTLMIRFNGGMMIGLFGAIAAIVVRGA